MGIASLKKSAPKPEEVKAVSLPPPTAPVASVPSPTMTGPIAVEALTSLVDASDDPDASEDAKKIRAEELARAFEAISLQIRKLEALKKSVAIKLGPLHREFSTDKVMHLPSGGAIELKKTGGRRAGRGDIIKKWPVEGPAFWESLDKGGKDRLSYKPPIEMGIDPEMED